jgi:hypothetical protein
MYEAGAIMVDVFPGVNENLDLLIGDPAGVLAAHIVEAL